MPKCLLNSVRGYRTGIYVGNPDYDPNVMTTRSGRSIRRVTLGLRNGNRTKCLPQQETGKAKQVVRKYPVVKYKSMSYMSFVTRFLISLRVPDLELAGVNPQETLEHLEDCQYSYRNDRVYSCSGDENTESTPSEELSDNYTWESDIFPEEESNSEQNDDGSVDNDDDIYNYDNVTEGESSDEECTDCNLEKCTISETKESPVIPDHEENIITLDQYRKTLDEKIKETREIENSNSILLNSPRIQSSSGLVTVKAAAAQFQNQIRPAVVVQLHPNDTCRPPLRCEDCKRDFTLLSAYTAHLKTHTKQRNKCNVCGKVFTRSWLLKGHMRTHTGERPFRCPNENCDKAFADKSNLRSHMMIHSVTSKNFTCQKCGRAFAQKRYLHKHLLEVCRVIS